MKIAIYSRKSIETDKGESIKNQIKLCKEYFNRQYTNCKFEVFEDEGFSGGNTNRPSFLRMMELAKIKQFDIIAVYRIDRIARNIVDFVNIYDELEKLDIKLVSITEGFDPTTPAGKMMMLLIASFAEMERMNIAQRVKDNMSELAKLGRWSGGTPPTGYTSIKCIEGGKSVTYLKLIESEKDIILKIFNMYANGDSTYKISKTFKDLIGINFPQKTIQNILYNPTYLISCTESINYLKSTGWLVFGEPNSKGFLPYNRRPKIKGKKITDNKGKFVCVSTHEGVIDIDLWIRVQEKLKENSVDPHPRESDLSWLSGGIIKCSCGGSMILSPGRKRKDGTRVLYFKCVRKQQLGESCSSKFLRVDIAESSTYDFIENMLAGNNLESLISDNKKTTNIESEIITLNKKINSTTLAINNLVEKLMILSNDASLIITDKIEELTKQNNYYKDELLHLEREKIFEHNDKNNAQIIQNQMKLFLSLDMSIPERRKYLRTFVDYIIWDHENEQLLFKLLT